MQRVALLRLQRTATIERLAKCVDHTAKQRVADVNGRGTSASNHAIARSNTSRVAEWDRLHDAVAKADDLHGQTRTVFGNDVAHGAHAHARPARLHEQTNGPNDTSPRGHRVDAGKLVDVAGQGKH